MFKSIFSEMIIPKQETLVRSFLYADNIKERNHVQYACIMVEDRKEGSFSLKMLKWEHTHTRHTIFFKCYFLFIQQRRSRITFRS